MEKEKYSIESVIKRHKEFIEEQGAWFTERVMSKIHDQLKRKLSATLEVNEELERHNNWHTHCLLKKKVALDSFNQLAELFKSLGYEVEFENEKLTISVPKELAKWVEINE